MSTQFLSDSEIFCEGGKQPVGSQEYFSCSPSKESSGLSSNSYEQCLTLSSATLMVHVLLPHIMMYNQMINITVVSHCIISIIVKSTYVISIISNQ